MLFASSSVGVRTCSNFSSSGLPVSEEGVRREVLDLFGSRLDGYERGSIRLILDREEVEDAMEGA
jgi:hypothetical protein